MDDKEMYLKIGELTANVKLLMQQQENFMESMKETVQEQEIRLTKIFAEYKQITDKRLDAMDKCIKEINNNNSKKAEGHLGRFLDLKWNIIWYFVALALGYICANILGVKM